MLSDKDQLALSFQVYSKGDGLDGLAWQVFLRKVILSGPDFVQVNERTLCMSDDVHFTISEVRGKKHPTSTDKSTHFILTLRSFVMYLI